MAEQTPPRTKYFPLVAAAIIIGCLDSPESGDSADWLEGFERRRITIISLGGEKCVRPTAASYGQRDRFAAARSMGTHSDT